MTREEFLSGAPFQTRAGSNIFYKYVNSGDIPRIQEHAGPSYMEYHCNVSKVSATHVTVYKSILGKCPHVRIALADLILKPL